MKRIINIFTILLLSSLANAKEDNYASQKDKIILTVATTEAGYFPYNYRENGVRKGLSVDVLNYFETNSNF